MIATGRYLTVLIAIAAWIAVCNHCTFAAVAPKPESANACPFHSKPTKPHAPAAPTQCCKILRAVSASCAKIPARPIVDLPPIDIRFAEPIISSSANVSLHKVFLDTGPPGSTSSVRLIESMRAHAPPEFA